MLTKNNYKNKSEDFLYRIYENTWLKSIRCGLLLVQPFILVCCILLVIMYIQVYFFSGLSSNIFIKSLFESCEYTYSKINSFTRIILLLTICYSLGKYKNKNLDIEINPIIVAIIGFISTIILTIEPEYIVSLHSNSRWVFSRIIISLVFSELFIFLYIKITPKVKLLGNCHQHILKQSINSVIPAFIVISILLFINTTFSKGIDNIYTSLTNVYLSSKNMYDGNNLFSIIRYLFDSQIYWFFGGHGGNIVDPELFGNSYINVFCNIGGAGSTICLIIAILISKSNRYKKSISKLSILPCIFNINEIIIYGLPIILNPIYLIPFILTPIVLSIIARFMVLIGFVSIHTISIHWMNPLFINSYLITKSFSGIVLQLVNILVGTIIYIPFVNISNKIYEREELVAYELLKNEIFSNEVTYKTFTNRSDIVGQIANILNSDLTENLVNNAGLYLEYQPQVNKEDKVVGVEALLRWRHDILGNIPPIIAIALAEETGLIKNLGKWIIKQSCYQLSVWSKELSSDISMSINISSTQLKDPFFVSYIKDTLNKYNVSPNSIKLEITESLALGNDIITKNQLNQLTDMGIKLVIDDFGVGYNPILYIKKYKIDSIKIDGSLIKDIDINEDSRNIVKAMYVLCESSGLEIVNEFVETHTHKRILDEMGNGIYQGYLFSKPLDPEKCLEYIKSHEK